jgi:DUF4097 and DUF4098 domain-containing protein YvlB
MKKNSSLKLFFGLLLFTITSFSLAAYSTKRAQIANPEVFTHVARHFNVSIDNSDGNFRITGIDDGNYEKTEKTWDLDGTMENLKISTKSAEVTIVNSTDDKFHIFSTGMIDKRHGPELFDVEFHDQDLFISDAGKKTKNVTLKIQVPTNKLRTLRGKSISGDFKLQGVHSEQIRLITVSGTTQLKDTSIKSIDAESTSGNIEIDNRIESNIDVKSISGELKIKSLGLDKSAFTLNSVSGEVINPFKSKSGGPTKVTANTVSGDIKILAK